MVVLLLILTGFFIEIISFFDFEGFPINIKTIARKNIIFCINIKKSIMRKIISG